MKPRLCILVCSLWLPIIAGDAAAAEQLAAGLEFTAADSISPEADSDDDAQRCVSSLSWQPATFEVRLEDAAAGRGDWLVRFPSASPVGHAVNDLAALEWFVARDERGAPRQTRGIVVVHESGRNMKVGRLIAQSLRAQGLHAFLLNLPGYGVRRVEGLADADRALPALRQAIADVRRARDAVAALPLVDDDVIALQGTSLGGFVAATVAGLDRGYDRVFILLAGGNLHDVVMNGAKDAARLREKLAAAGVTEEQIRQYAYEVEPLRLAHRVDPATTWLFSGKYDDIVPPRCSAAFAQAAQLAPDHHIELAADHYSGIIYLPHVVQQMVRLTAAQ